jgi:hypothetical protein
MLLGPPWTDTGEPGALADNDCCDALEGMLPEGQEMNEIEDAASNRINRLILARIVATEVNAGLLSVSGVRRFGGRVSSRKVCDSCLSEGAA